MGQCGVGDLMLTCSSIKSRNYSLGFELGQGKKLADILAARNSVTEGVHTAQAAAEIARSRNIDMPIVNMVCSCLHNNLDPKEAFVRLMERPSRAEID
jgi:glycerol-3-phosphate dehydrogenase (NAD(P)+)